MQNTSIIIPQLSRATARRALERALKGGLLNFARLMLPHVLTSGCGDYHRRLCGLLDGAMEPGGRLLGALPREHAKTTLGTVALVLRELCRGALVGAPVKAPGIELKTGGFTAAPTGNGATARADARASDIPSSGERDGKSVKTGGRSGPPLPNQDGGSGPAIAADCFGSSADLHALQVCRGGVTPAAHRQ